MLSGHVALGFDDIVVVLGGSVSSRDCEGGQLSTAPMIGVWALDVPNECWRRIGDLKTAAASLRAVATAVGSDGETNAPRPAPNASWPAATICAAACAKHVFSVSSGIESSLPLDVLSGSGIHLTDERETGQYVAALSEATKRQAAFAGVLVIRDARPMMVHSEACFLFGGYAVSNRRPSNDLLRVELTL